MFASEWAIERASERKGLLFTPMFDRYLSSAAHTTILRVAYDWRVIYGHCAPRMGVVCATIRPYCGAIETRQTSCRNSKLSERRFTSYALTWSFSSIHSAPRSSRIPLVLSYSTLGVSGNQSGRRRPRRPIGAGQPRRECKRLYRIIHGWESVWMKEEHVRLMIVMSHSETSFTFIQYANGRYFFTK